MSNLNEIEFNKVCRTCLSSSEDMKSLYATDSDLTHVCCAEMLMSFTPLKLSLNDGFPNQICCICISELNQFHTFQLKCLRSEIILRSCKDKMVHTEKTSNFEKVFVKKEFFEYSDNINKFEENSSCAVTTSLQDPLKISDSQKDSRQELDLKKQEFLDIKIEKDEGEKPYVCTVCDSMFADEKCLATHKRTHIREKRNSFTKKSFTQNISLLRHVQSHKKESSSASDSSRCSDIENDQSCAATKSLQEPLTIAEINKELSQELDIKHGLIDVNIDNEHDINISSNSSLVNLSDEITTRSSLNVTSERPNSCTICDRAFKSKSHLNRHLVTHIGKISYTCTLCNKSFPRKLNLSNHMLNHTGEKPYACTICYRCFSVKSKLTVHLRKHTGEKPYTCTVCDNPFALKHHLTNHMLSHTGEKPYACTICDRRFTVKSKLIFHLRKHTGEKPYTCTECNKSFTSQKYLKHLRKHTGEKPYSSV